MHSAVAVRARRAPTERMAVRLSARPEHQRCMTAVRFTIAHCLPCWAIARKATARIVLAISRIGTSVATPAIPQKRVGCAAAPCLEQVNGGPVQRVLLQQSSLAPALRTNEISEERRY